MAGIETLIEKLKQQHQSKAPVEQMLATLQMLQKEITGGLKETSVLGTSGVTVLTPNIATIQIPHPVENIENGSKEYFELPETEASEEEINELLINESLIKTAAAEPPAEPKSREESGDTKPRKTKKTKEQPEFRFGDEEIENLADVPTFAQYAKTTPSEKKEKEVAVKHLKKAISDEDRQIFLSELFRGDEVMYERSVKTIDNFYAFAEAEFWIRRELKTKIGWPPNSPIVAKFDQLVKKRFS